MVSQNTEKLISVMVIAIVSMIVTFITFWYLNSEGYFESESATGTKILTGGAAGFIIIFVILFGAFHFSIKKNVDESARVIAELVADIIKGEAGNNKSSAETKYHDYYNDIIEKFHREGRFWKKEFKRQLKLILTSSYLKNYNIRLDLRGEKKDMTLYEIISQEETLK